MVFLMVFVVYSGVFASPDMVDAKGITSAREAEKEALKKVKNATVTEIDSDYENGVLVYEVELVKGTKEYDITYRASDGKMIAYGWEENSYDKYSQKSIMGESACRKLAQKKVKDGKITSIVQKTDDGADVYKVKMTKGSKNYTLEYHARTRKLLEYKWEITAKTSGSSNNGYIGTEKAKKIALKRVPGATVVKVEFDMDDGVPVYEVELINGVYEYEITIHAKTGKILEYEQDYID